jgi:uncharacterized repeat protein (TIGR01451 family)
MGIAACLLAFAAVSLAETNDVLITKFDDTDPVRVNALLTYSIALTNSGPDAADDTVVTDVLPDDVEFVSCATSQGTYTQELETVSCYLGQLAAGATAAVQIVVRPTIEGVITNNATLSGDTGLANNRASEVTTVEAANRPPEITLPGPHTLAVGATTSFVVSVQDPDHDSVVLNDSELPDGASYISSNFTWTAGSDDENTTNLLVFVADDQQGETNSVITNTTVIVVPFDYDGDEMSDAWEWNQFGTLTNGPDGDVDGDTLSNGDEYVAGTAPTSSMSRFVVDGMLSSTNESVHHVNISTKPGRLYTIEYTDQELSNGVPWSGFANSADGIGTWTETNSESSSYLFVDDESVDTTGGSPANGRRYYRVRVERP